MITLTPGRTTLADWRAVADGAGVRLDPAAFPAVEAGARTVDAIVARGEPVYGINTGFGKLASVHIGADDLLALQRNIVLSHAAGVGEPMHDANARLMMALKLASLGHGASGVRPQTIAMLEAMLERGIMPVVPSQGSVGASGDLAPLAHMAAAMLGVGEARFAGETMPADAALARAGLAPLVLGPKEGLALLNGTQFSTAEALAGLFAIERVFHAALITGALTTDAAKGSDTPFDARIHALRGHRGQIEVAAALRTLMAGSPIRASHLANDDRVQDPYCLRCQPQVMGAVLDLARQAAATLATEANGVSDNPLIFADSGEALSGGNFHAEPVAFAADMMALAICEIGSLAERRIAMLIDPALSGLPAFLTPQPGLNSGFMLAQVTAAALVSENKQRAYPASVDSIPTSANQEDHVSMAAHGARRLAAMAENAVNVIAIELIAAAQGCDFHAPLTSSAPLERARVRLRERVPQLEHDRYLAPDIAAAADLVRSGALTAATAWTSPASKDGMHDRAVAHREAGRYGSAGVVPAYRPERSSGVRGRAGIVPAGASRRRLAYRQALRLCNRLGATTVHTALSRTVIDVNRDPSGASLYPGQATTGLVPTKTFDGRALYRDGQAPTPDEIERRKALYFAPYHRALAGEIERLRARHPRVVLYDCHSIRSVEPRLFSGELPVFNIGTNSGKSCDSALEAAVAHRCAASPWSHVVNGRFTGGWITRTYGRPAEGVHAVQMELAMRGYLPNEKDPPPWDPDFAKPIQQTLRAVLEDCLAFARG